MVHLRNYVQIKTIFLNPQEIHQLYIRKNCKFEMEEVKISLHMLNGV